MVVSFVYASDEHPFYTFDFNDLAAIIVEEQDQTPVNILTFRKQTTSGLVTVPLALQDLVACPTLLRLNDVAPNPSILNGTFHSVHTGIYYDHEFSASSAKLTRVTGDDPTTDDIVEVVPMRPGTHRVKLGVQDVGDHSVDAALFIPQDGVRFVPILPADFNLDGIVDIADMNIIASNMFETGRTFAEGDANFDGVVDGSDFNIWNDHYGETGWANHSADFNFDGVVDGSDFNVWNTFYPTDKCATRAEGDTDDDGDVDIIDLNNWVLQAF